MKKRNFVIGLVVALAIGIGTTAYAAVNGNPNPNPNSVGLGFGRITSVRGYEVVESVLKDKLGLTDTDIVNAKNSRKSLYDIAKEKGMTEDQFKASIYDEKAKKIDESVKSNKITKEQGDTLKSNIKSRMENCDGNFGKMQGQRRGRGMARNGQRGENCLFNSSNTNK